MSSWFVVFAIVGGASLAGCDVEKVNLGGSETNVQDGGNGDGSDLASDPDQPLVPASKIDVLFVVDDSASMGDKQDVLAGSLTTFLSTLARTKDLHVGFITSSLGTFGSDVCDDTSKNARAHLQNPRSASPDGAPTPFLSWTPGGDLNSFLNEAKGVIEATGQNGCGIEMPLEAAYRFLVQPDPPLSVDVVQNVASQSGVDDTILAQRAKFLRPDSLVLVVMLTDEDDASVDPLAVGGQGWAFASPSFPGSPVPRAAAGGGTTAARGTSVCATDPASPDCTSCAFAATCDRTNPACQRIVDDPNCVAAPYFDQDDDAINVRMHRMKERYGIEPRFPIRRYADGFTRSKVPSRANEHVSAQAMSSDNYVPAGTGGCTNPLFAASLPSSSAEELCNLPRGPRSRELVVFSTITGIPASLVTNGTPDWTKAVGANPDAYDLTGIDPHMLPSVQARPGLPPPSDVRGDDGSDPIHGREWDTHKNDLQYACTFTLPTTRVCTPSDSSCDCASSDVNPPICAAEVGSQTHAKAYPSVRPLLLARALGTRGVVGSICAAEGDLTYESTLDNIATRITPLVTPL